MPKKYDSSLNIRVNQELIDKLKREAEEEDLQYSTHVRRKLNKPHKK
jgi:predicted DNA binding CopG/RHH family protein